MPTIPFARKMYISFSPFTFRSNVFSLDHSHPNPPHRFVGGVEFRPDLTDRPTDRERDDIRPNAAYAKFCTNTLHKLKARTSSKWMEGYRRKIERNQDRAQVVNNTSTKQKVQNDEKKPAANGRGRQEYEERCEPKGDIFLRNRPILYETHML